MKRFARRSAGARRDLIEIVRYYTREAGLRTARRFIAQAEATFARLADMPGIGARLNFEWSGETDLRFSTISRFRAYLVFYRTIEGGIEIVRVLHGARDIPSLLAEDLGADRDDGAAEGGDGHGDA